MRNARGFDAGQDHSSCHRDARGVRAGVPHLDGALRRSVRFLRTWFLRAWVTPCILLGSTAACSDEPGGPRPLPLPFSDPIPLPGCEGFNYQGCDIHALACVEELYEIAACSRGGQAGPPPPVSFLSEEQARLDLLARLLRSPPPQPNHFEIALTELGLTQPQAFEPESTATRLAQRWAAFYRRDLGDVVVIEHAPATTPGSAPAAPYEVRSLDALVFHELIHALQDRELDLDDFSQRFQTDTDGDLRGLSVVEGEAQLHEERLRAALSGVDAASFDWQSALRERSEAAERSLFAEDDLYSASLLRVPYAHGLEYVQGVWSQGGAASVRALLHAPPGSMREILASVWGGPSEASDGPVPEAGQPTVPGAQLEAWSQLGAWGLYLMLEPRLERREQARELALRWRSDRFEAFSYGESETAARWSIELADAQAAASLAAALSGTPGVAIRQSASRVRLLSGSDAMPPPALAE